MNASHLVRVSLLAPIVGLLGCIESEASCQRGTWQSETCFLLESPGAGLVDAAPDPAAAPVATVVNGLTVVLPPGGVGWVRLPATDHHFEKLAVRPAVPLEFHAEATGPQGPASGDPAELRCGGTALEVEGFAGGWLRIGPTEEPQVVAAGWDPSWFGCE